VVLPSVWEGRKLNSLHEQPTQLWSPGKHVPALDGVRGVAIALVLLHHFVLFSGIRPAGWLEWLFSNLARSGWIGVDLFFVLSGFLISGILCDSKGEAGYFRRFYIRRALRIFPLYYATLIGYFIVLPLLVPLGERYAALARDQIWYWTYLVNWQIGLNGWPESPGLGHFWSLAVEEQFYLIWPLVVFLLTRRQLVALCLAIIAASFALRVALHFEGHIVGAYVLTPARMDSLAWGALLAIIARTPRGLQSLRRWSWPAFALTVIPVIGAILFAGALNSESLPTQTFGYSVLGLMFAGLIALVITSRPRGSVDRLLSSRPLVALGRYSYALYVLHHPVLYLVQRSGFRVVDGPRLLGSQLPLQLAYMVLLGGVCLLLAILSWQIIESPFLRLKERFAHNAAAPSREVELYETSPVAKL
jgi:peptidoglycan/LPS O-acetylase OafA/YrhL